ncbi:MAG: nucleoside-diphosphate kinase [Methanobacteriota archaeon]
MNTLIIIKPWAVQRGLVGEILARFERHGIRIAAVKSLRLSKEKAEKLYAVHEGKPFFKDVVGYMTSTPIVAAVLETDMLDDEAAVALVRKIVGATDPTKAEMGTIRGDFGMRKDRNIIHASDSPESAEYEIPLFFTKNDIVSYAKQVI